MRKSNSLAYSLILAITVFTGCRDLTDEVSISDPLTSDEFQNPEPVVLGQQYEPSWEVESMRTFYSAMVEANPNARMLSAEEAIQTSHYYMRFLPENSEEYDTLRAVGIDMYPYPLDYSLEQSGDAYLETSESDTIIWQYAIVDNNLEFPSYIQHEILQETYMPLLVEEEGVGSGRIAKIMLDDEVSAGEFLEMCAILDNNLLDSALIALNLFDSLYYDASLEDTVNSGGRIQGRKWKFRLKSPIRAIAQAVKTVRNTINSIRILKWGPKGNIRIQYFHPRTGDFTVEGVANIEVIARQGLLNRRTFTRSDGSYVFEFPAFAPVLYQLRFQNNYITIRNRTGFGTAFKIGDPRALNSGWNYTAPFSDSYTQSYCAVMNAVNDYYKVLPGLRNEYETDAPPRNLKIKITQGKDPASKLISETGWMHGLNQTVPYFLSPFFNDIGVHKIDGDFFTYDRVYAVTIHELGHAAHWGLVGWTAAQSAIVMNNTESRVRETWADGVMQLAYRRKFNANVAYNSSHTSGDQGSWLDNHQQCDDSRTSLVGEEYNYMVGPDLWDNFNQSCGGIDDRVNGIRLIHQFRALKNARTWNDWRDELIKQFPDQRNEITDYFGQF